MKLKKEKTFFHISKLESDLANKDECYMCGGNTVLLSIPFPVLDPEITCLRCSSETVIATWTTPLPSSTSAAQHINFYKKKSRIFTNPQVILIYFCSGSNVSCKK